jgi:hypothetical protein
LPPTCYQPAHIVGISKTTYVLTTPRCLNWRHDLQRSSRKGCNSDQHAGPPRAALSALGIAIGTVASSSRAGGDALTLLPPASASKTNSSGSLRITLTSRSGAPLPGITIWLTITGPTSYSGTAITNADGMAAFAVRPTAPYTVRVRAAAHGSQVASTTIRVETTPPAVATTDVLGRFYPSDNRCSFDTPAGVPPLFSERFSTINFGGRPFTGFGTVAGVPSRVAASGINVAGLGAFNHFNAVFTGNLLVRRAGSVPLTVLIDDAFDFGVGGGAIRVSGALSNPPRGGLTALERLPVVGAFNQGHLEATTQVTIRFPHPGSYPYEIDYAECMGGNEALRISTAGQFLPNAGS